MLSESLQRDTLGVVGTVLCVLILSVLLIRAISFFKRLPYPPGPPGKLLSGIVHLLPRVHPWKTYKAWSEQYKSPIISFRIFRTRVFVLNTAKAITDLLDGRSAIYSDRIQPVFHCELVGRKCSPFSVSSEDRRFKLYRKMIQTGLNPRAVKSYAPVLERERDVLLGLLQDTPDGFVGHFRRNAGAVILSVTYGLTVTSEDDYFVSLFHRAVEIYSQTTRPGSWLVDYFPILRFIPAWLPGGTFKRKAYIWRKEFDKLSGEPFQWTKDQMANGQENDSFVSRLLRTSSEEESILEHAAEALYGGGLDTVRNSVSCKAWSAAQTLDARARAEVDCIVGRDRLPTLEDEEHLLYVCAVMKELLRFQPVARQGIPHRLVVDDVYNGSYLPAGATIISNIWAAMNDPTVYHKPEVFEPSRFLQDDHQPREIDSRKFAFGFGKRRCPGDQMAWASIFINVTSILWAFTLEKPVDEHGQEYMPTPDYTTELVRFILNLVDGRYVSAYMLLAAHWHLNVASALEPEGTLREEHSLR